VIGPSLSSVTTTLASGTFAGVGHHVGEGHGCCRRATWRPRSECQPVLAVNELDEVDGRGRRHRPRGPVSRPLAPRKLAASRLAAGVEVFSSTDTVLLKRFAATRSARPSPLTSAVVTEAGESPTAKGGLRAEHVGAGAGGPCPAAPTTVLLFWFAVIRSAVGRRPFTSAVVTEAGLRPTAMVAGRAERAGAPCPAAPTPCLPMPPMPAFAVMRSATAVAVDGPPSSPS